MLEKRLLSIQVRKELVIKVLWFSHGVGRLCVRVGDGQTRREAAKTRGSRKMKKRYRERKEMTRKMKSIIRTP